MKNIDNVKPYLDGLDKMQKTITNRDKSYFAYIKSLSQILVVLLGFLIGLKSNVPLNNIPKVLFLLSITLIGLTILFSQRLLFYEVSIQENEVKAYRQSLIKLQNQTEKASFVLVKSKKEKFFQFFEKATFYCFGLSIISLIFYCIFSYFPICEFCLKHSL